MDFVEDAIIDDPLDHVFHVIGLVWAVRDNRVEFGVGAQWIVLRRHERRVFHVVLRHVAEHLAHEQQRLRLVFANDVADAAFGRVNLRSAEFFKGHIFVRHLLDDIRPGDEHIAGVLDHENEVGQRRAVDRPARARPHDHADLRDDAAGKGIAQENVGVAAETDDSFLNARAAAVVQADQRRAGLHRHVHDFADFPGSDFAQRAADDREILRKDVDQPPVDRPPAGDDAVGRITIFFQSEVARAMRDKGIEFAKAARIEQDVQPLTSGIATEVMLTLDAFLAATFAASVRAVRVIVQLCDCTLMRVLRWHCARRTTGRIK